MSNRRTRFTAALVLVTALSILPATSAFAVGRDSDPYGGLRELIVRTVKQIRKILVPAPLDDILNPPKP